MSSAYRSTASRENLQARARLLRRLRQFFDERDFIEVQTPVISQGIVVDRHLEPMVVTPFDAKVGDPSTSEESDRRPAWIRFLQTSPELGMKRLLASGLERIYQVGPVFRAGEFGTLHNPEFTMAEWYRVADNFGQGIQLAEELVVDLLQCPLFDRVSYQDAFAELVGVDPLTCSTDKLAEICVRQQLVEAVNWTDDRDDWLNLLFSHRIQPRLGLDRPVTLTHFPVSQAALAVVRPEDKRTAERFELFYKGIELANGYHELTDAKVLRQRDRIANQQRRADGKNELPETSYLLDAMDAGLPSSSGCALGFDRIVMIACRAETIQEVLCFPWERA